MEVKEGDGRRKEGRGQKLERMKVGEESRERRGRDERRGKVRRRGRGVDERERGERKVR